MSSRNGSYARIVDAMSKRSNDKGHAASPANSNQNPSPDSAKTDFDTVKKTAPNLQAKRNIKQFGPSPERRPQPKGMGERGPNWEAYIKRAEALRDQHMRPRARQTKAPKHIAAKAQKAALQKRAASKGFDKSQDHSC